MSYARKLDGDVYVFLSVGGHLECCMCDLPGPDTFITTTTAAMLSHLDEHIAAGHEVPDDARLGLKADQSVNDRWMELVAAGVDGDEAWGRAHGVVEP